MRKNLSYYLKLDYLIEIRKIPKKDGGGWLASIPQLGDKAFCADGETIQEAIANLRKVKKQLFSDYIKEGIPIPKPEPESESIFSGKFVVRITPNLHRELVERAQKEKVSLNQLVVHLLSYNLPLRALEKKMDEHLSKVEGHKLQTQVRFLDFHQLTKYTFPYEPLGKVGK
jgi:predicted HicB family RNase H-like nuclease